MHKFFTALFDWLTECKIAFALIVMFAYGLASAASADESLNNAVQSKKEKMMFFLLVMWDKDSPETSITIPSAYAKLDDCNEAGETIAADVHATTGRVRKWLCRAEFTNNKELMSSLNEDIKHRDSKGR